MDPMLGQIILFAGNYAPRGWDFCQGQLLPITQNQALYSLLGTYYGGDGRSTFALPDLRGRVPVGAGTGPGLSPRRMGDQFGMETSHLSTENLPAHSHTATFTSTGSQATTTTQASDDDGGETEPTGNYWATGSNGGSNYSASANTNMAAGAVQVDVQVNGDVQVGLTGGGRPVNNMPPSLCMNYIIAIQGYFPTRS